MADKASADGIGSLFNSERFSDIIIRCNGRRWYAHKAVLCTQSKFFTKAYEGPYKTADYDERGSSDFILNVLTFNVKVFALAEKYFVDRLLQVAAQKFKAALLRSFSEDDFAEAVEEWSSATSDPDKTLGNIIIEGIMARKSRILNPDKRDSRFRDVLDKTPWLAAEIAMLLTEQVGREVKTRLFKCPNMWCAWQFMAILEPGKSYRYTCQGCRYISTFTGESGVIVYPHQGPVPFLVLEQV